MERVACKEVAALFGIDTKPLFIEVRRWPKAHPQYVLGHADRTRAIQQHLDLHSGLLIAGASLYGAAIADIVENGRATAQVISDMARTRLA